jgi:hypothetical protein
MTNSEKGHCAEARFVYEVCDRGWKVYVPIGHAHAADIIIHRPPHHPVPVQVKTATYYANRDDYGFKCGRGKNRVIPYIVGDFQILAAWLPNLQKFVFWRFDEIADRKKICYTPRLHRQPDNWDLLDSVLK